MEETKSPEPEPEPEPRPDAKVSAILTDNLVDDIDDDLAELDADIQGADIGGSSAVDAGPTPSLEELNATLKDLDREDDFDDLLS
eukprot:169656-Amorphochlora_amoeboformis.AAC.1